MNKIRSFTAPSETPKTCPFRLMFIISSYLMVCGAVLGNVLDLLLAAKLITPTCSNL